MPEYFLSQRRIFPVSEPRIMRQFLHHVYNYPFTLLALTAIVLDSTYLMKVVS